MKKNKFLILGIIFVFAIFLSLQCSAYVKSSIQYVSPGLVPGFASSGGQWIPDRTMCEAGQDFAVQIEPFGCTPAVVRSDLLEEQNAPVFCQLSATKINTLLNIEAIDSISFAGKQLPNSISGVGFYPAQAALGVPNKLNSPVLNNIGYAVIVLKKQPNASAMPDMVSGNLTATLKYNIKDAYGIGDTRFYLPEINNEQVWEGSIKQYGFWNQKGYLRAETITADEAKLSVYTDRGKLKIISLNKGETSQDIYLPGFDCFVGVKLKLEDLVSPDTRAILTVNGDTIQLNKGETFLENKCTFINWERRGLTKKAEISCKADDGTERFELVLTPRVSLNIRGETKPYSVGDFLYEGTQDGKKVYIYLGYVGTKGDSERLDDLYVTLVSSPVSSGSKLSDSAISTYSSRAEGIYSNVYRDKSVILRTLAEIGGGIRTKTTSLYDSLSKNTDLKYIQYKSDAIWASSELKDKSDNKFAGEEVKVVDFASPINLALKEGGTSSNYYKSASQDYSKVVSSFAAEKDPVSAEIILGEESFIQNIKLAGFLNQKNDVGKLCKDFKSAYPSSSRYAGDFELKNLCENPTKQSSVTSFSKEVTINSKQKIISLEDIRSPSFEEYGARVKITLPDGNIQYLDLIKDKINYFGTGNTQYIQLTMINRDTISLNVNTTRAGLRQYSSNAETLKKGNPTSFGTPYVFEVTDIYEKKNAKVSVTSTINRAQTEANFSFFIGIEKRSIQLSPEKTKERIEDLNKTISDWSDKSKKLGTLVEGMKGACLATGLALTMKNFLDNVDGKSIARQEVMNGEGGWNKKCLDAVTTKNLDGKPVTYKTVEECFVGEASNIDKQVNSLYEILQKQDEEIKKLQDNSNCKLKDEGLFFEEVIDTECLKKAYSAQISGEMKSSLKEYTFKYNNQDVDSSEILNLMDKNKISIEDMRAIQLYARARNSGQLGDISKRELDKLFADIYSSSQMEIATLKSAESEGISADKIPHLSTGKDSAKTVSYSGLKYSEIISKRKLCSLEVESSQIVDGQENFGASECGLYGIEASTPVQYFTMDNGKTYVATLDKQGTKLFIKNLYDVKDSKFLEGKDKETIVSKFNFEIMNEESYKGKGYKSSSGSSIPGPVLRCYETEPYKGYPAVAPVNTRDGWYVSISQNLPVSGNIGSYDASGRITSFWMCNVWTNGIEENKGGDDKCTLINLGTGQTLQIGGLSASESGKLVDEARKIVEAGQKACKTGKAGDVLNLGINAKGIKMGTPAANIPDLSCYNFMSPEDCKILFNVCDPVVCPSSRCNFGGKYPVRDVIQSGIIGSLVLCLPNFAGFGGDVYIPVCLSGLKAGLDSLLSVFEAYRDCLQESLDTGQMVGVCDEIYSIHLCEFFWRQTLPLANMIVPKTIELVMGQSVRGGGEYLSVQNAWTTAGQSMNYFAQYYAAESYAAFKSRIAQEVTDAVCKTYISGAYPDGGKIIDTLTKADSPPQFTGRFDEIAYTTATNPPISQYKVFYHIYAGNDSRVYYQVYLTDVGESSYYQDTSMNLVVDTGYIVQGGKVTQTKDFTAVSGYKKMCITINGQTECGFKQVSTSFALDYVADQYVKEQANETGITSESTCVSGTPSIWSLASINPEGAADELVSPKLYNRGIIRICANENPGLSTDKDSTSPRWVSVGYCGKKEVKCWLDTQSVKDAVNFDSTAQTVLASTTQNFLTQMIAEGKYLSDAQFTIAVGEIGKQDAASRINTINSVMNKALMNSQKGKLYLLRAMAYNELASEGFKTEKIEADKLAAEEAMKIEQEIQKGVVQEQESKKCIELNPLAKKYYDAIDFFKSMDQKVRYSESEPIKIRIDQLKSDGLIEESEYNEIRGPVNRIPFVTSSPFGVGEKDVAYVLSLLNTKFTQLCSDVSVSAAGECGEGWVRSSTGLCVLKGDCGESSLAEIMENLKTTSVAGRTCKCGDKCSEYANKIIQLSEEYGFDKLIFLSLIMQESSCNSSALSSTQDPGKTSVGLMQISLQHCGKYGLSSDLANCKSELLNDPLKNMEVGAQILKSMYVSYKSGITFNGCTNKNVYYSGWNAALRGYNGLGCGKDAKGNKIVSQDNFVEEINSRYSQLTSLCVNGAFPTATSSGSGASGNAITSATKNHSVTLSYVSGSSEVELSVFTTLNCDHIYYQIYPFTISSLFGAIQNTKGDLKSNDITSEGIYKKRISVSELGIAWPSGDPVKYYLMVNCQNSAHDLITPDFGFNREYGPFRIPKSAFSAVPSDPNYATLAYQDSTKTLRLSVVGPSCDHLSYKIYPYHNHFRDVYTGTMTSSYKEGTVFVYRKTPFIPIEYSYVAEITCYDKNNNSVGEILESNKLDFDSSQVGNILDRINSNPTSVEKDYATLAYQDSTKTLRLSVVGPSCNYTTYKIFPYNPSNEPYSSERIGTLSEKQGTLFVKTFSPFRIADRVYYAEVYCYDSNKKQVGDLIKSNTLEFDSSQLKYVGEA